MKKLDPINILIVIAGIVLFVAICLPDYIAIQRIRSAQEPQQTPNAHMKRSWTIQKVQLHEHYDGTLGINGLAVPDISIDNGPENVPLSAVAQ